MEINNKILFKLANDTDSGDFTILESNDSHVVSCEVVYPPEAGESEYK